MRVVLVEVCVVYKQVSYVYHSCWFMGLQIIFFFSVKSSWNITHLYRVIHKSVRDFRPLRYSSRDGHAEGKHVSRGRDTPSFCPTLQVLDMSNLGDVADANPVIKFLPHTLHVCDRNLITGLTSAASPRVDISSTCKVGQKLGVSLPLLTCSPSAWPSRPLYRRGRKSRRDLRITPYVVCLFLTIQYFAALLTSVFMLLISCYWYWLMLWNIEGTIAGIAVGEMSLNTALKVWRTLESVLDMVYW